jgi:hypothetical protein
MFIIYGIPYLYVNNWLVFITYLQHTDPVLPHYSAEKWTFARGALATIDRTFMGPVGGWILHGICETHVAHHTSSKIPHYNAWEATDALKKFLGPHYQRSEENMFVSFYKAHRDCLVCPPCLTLNCANISSSRTTRVSCSSRTQLVLPRSTPLRKVETSLTLVSSSSPSSRTSKLLFLTLRIPPYILPRYDLDYIQLIMSFL